MMTKKEQVAFRKLELENANLKQQLDKHFGIYRDHLYELIELRTKLQTINEITTILSDEAAL